MRALGRRGHYRNDSDPADAPHNFSLQHLPKAHLGGLKMSDDLRVGRNLLSTERSAYLHLDALDISSRRVSSLGELFDDSPGELVGGCQSSVFRER